MSSILRELGRAREGIDKGQTFINIHTQQLKSETIFVQSEESNHVSMNDFLTKHVSHSFAKSLMILLP